MDPTKNLDAALEHARLIVAVSEDLDNHPEADNVCVDDTSLSLAQTFLDLNEWISQGFPLPAQWVDHDRLRVAEDYGTQQYLHRDPNSIEAVAGRWPHPQASGRADRSEGAVRLAGCRADR